VAGVGVAVVGVGTGGEEIVLLVCWFAKKIIATEFFQVCSGKNFLVLK
jgi:hypothetical protein